MPAFPKPIDLAHLMMEKLIQPSDNVVDATLGNGHDALFLARLVGETGRVIGFDVQPEAINSSMQRMIENGISNYKFHPIGHENMREVIAPENLPLAAVMFNLGYLPNGDKSIITTAGTSLLAIAAALDMLKIGGLISIMCYPGHEGGDAESLAISEWAENLPRETCRAVKYALHNAINHPPFLILLEKIA